ncbi:alpha-L-fucosidase [Pedobacter cryoconitis]|uniref:alpha-L-fucosidase n=1 Tax=Pedobacter cryoconitis TaxID=188932 RepID=A0A127VE79_9SPHI|nr:alpha-L-fucosidase [Pedobacter cryoconitis]AMP99521.1 alpha-L-fucosidase [Pedobacter cryoconitis]
MKRRTLLRFLAAGLPGLYLAHAANAAMLRGISSALSPELPNGFFEPDWNSLSNYKTPDWFRDAKFGMWAHWGPQCQPEAGDWYARNMYMEGSSQYKFHLKKYGHPSKFGFKDVINTWKAEKWDPQGIVDLYHKTGAKYFMALANHHDNFDLYDSSFQKNWNSTKIGPKKDIVKGWSDAARKRGMHFGVSVHAAHTWSWWETARRSDKSGAYAGIPYDGKVNENQGKGEWWDGLDPQELYAQNHPLSENSSDNGMIHKQWDWGNGVSLPDKKYIEKFYKRTIELIDKYGPDMVYFDDSQLPLWPIDDAGLKIAAHFYNKSIKEKGRLDAVITGKILDPDQRKAMVWDIERGQSNGIEPLPWQTDTCIGDWHYNKEVYDNKRYKTARSVIHTLIDVVSKNGNLMLNIPLKGDGTMDDIELGIVEEIGKWMRENGESIYSTRPWKIFGEGPAQAAAAALSAQGFNEGKGKPFNMEDVRFVTKGDLLFATIMSDVKQPSILIKSLSTGNPYYPKRINRVELVATKMPLKFTQDEQGLKVFFADVGSLPSFAVPLKISSL